MSSDQLRHDEVENLAEAARQSYLRFFLGRITRLRVCVDIPPSIHLSNQEAVRVLGDKKTGLVNVLEKEGVKEVFDMRELKHKMQVTLV